MKCAIIDMGSNTVRLSVYQVDGTNFRQLFTSKEMAGLASYIENKHMTKDGVIRAAGVLNKFYSVLQQFQIDHTAVFATASLRNIENGKEVVNELFRETGYRVEILSGHEEALCDFYGVLYNIDIESGMIFDIGGGSTELVTFEKRKPCIFESIGIGSLNLYNEYVEKIVPKHQEQQHLQKRIREELKVVFGCKRHARQLTKSGMIGVGGTARAVLKLVNAYYYLESENRVIAREQLKEILDLASSRQKDMQRLILKICPERVHTIVPGMMILKNLVRDAECDNIIVSKYGVREGYLYRKFLSEP